ncbi:DUF7331 family protein [Haloarchaeobius sp. HME9146]|uniref:DUF7331 family protein n=1 Tax=unclassified Haloarchaeobius TaxID=2614452 RepID=UPI0021C18F3E|nr:hypothetical protein [Haloarchaeobius sp. HME9146]MCT9096147.1 hypothetical protein [Haloarchaeobius sp. HME9146]
MGLSDHASNGDGSTPDQSAADGTESIETYETEDSVVFYDAENPLAWLEATKTFALRDVA